MKLLQTADWHLGPFKGPADKEGMNLRYKTTVECLEYMVGVARSERPDIVCISGDLFHQEQVGPARYSDEMLTATRIITELAETAKLVIVMRGTPNHDGAGQFRVLTKMFENNRKVAVVTEPQVISTPLADIAVVPGFDKQAFRAKFPGLSADEENQVWTEQIGMITAGLRAQCNGIRNFLMAHYTVPGCNIESGQTSCYANFEPVLPREVLKATAFDLVLLGHIHRPQRVEGLENVFYSGAINAINFNDEGQARGFWMHYSDADSEFYRTPHNEFQTITWEPDDVTAYLREGTIFMESEGYRELIGGKIVRLQYSCSDAQKRALNIPVLQADLMKMGAFYVANIESEQTIEVQNRGLMNEESDPYENLKKWLDEKCVKDAGAVAELAAPIIGQALKQIEATEYQGEFKPVKISVKNYRAYREAEFDYTDISFLSVNGVNGAGKSSLFFDAPMDCLFEKTREGDVKAWLRAAPDARSGSIEFTFSIGEHMFRVTRTRQKSGKGTVNLSRMDAGGEWVNMSSEKGADTQKEIEHVLGMDYMTFKTCALIMQDQYGLFLEARKDERIAILSNLLGLSIYGVMEKNARDLLAAAKRDYASGKTAVQVKEQQIANKGDPESELAELERNINDLEGIISGTTAQITKLRKDIDEADSLKAKLDDITGKVSALFDEICSESVKAFDLSAAIDKRNEVLANADVIEAEAESYDRAMATIAELSQDVARHESANERLADVCIEIGSLDNEIASASSEIDRANAEIERMEREAADAEDVARKVRELEAAEAELAAARKRQGDYYSLVNEMEQRSKNVSKLISLADNRIELLRHKLSGANRQKDFMEMSGCIDAANARCRFLSQAKEDVAGIPAIEQEIKDQEASKSKCAIALEQLNEEYNDRIKATGFSPEDIPDLEEKVKRLAPARERASQIASKNVQIASLRASVAEKVKSLDEKQKSREKRAYERSELTETVSKLAESVKRTKEAKLVCVKCAASKMCAKDIPALRAKNEADLTAANAINESLEAKHAEMARLEAESKGLDLLLAEKDPDASRAMLSEMEKNLESLRGNGDALRMRMGAATQRIEDIKVMREEIADLRKGIDEAADLAAKYEVLKTAFSQDGVPHQIIRNIIPYIRDKANGILGAMTGGTMGVDFVMEKTVKGRDGEKATLDIIIEEYGKTALPYTSKSGGEKVKASLAVNLSLAEVKMEASGVQIGFLGVDEPPFLDEDGTQAYVDSMEAIRKRNPRISIIAITHDPAMKARFSQSLTVVKSAEDGSKIIYD